MEASCLLVSYKPLAPLQPRRTKLDYAASVRRTAKKPSMRALILILGAVLGMSEKRVQFKLAATVAYESVPSRAQTLGEAAGLREVKRVFRHAPKHEAKHRAQGLHLWYTGAAATAADADRAVAQLQADPDVASAELDQEVQML